MTRAGDPDAIDTKQVAELLEGRYQLGELIGRGGMAEVHRGVDLRLDREVAIKLLAHSPGADRARFAAEARMLAQFNHPNLVRLFDAGDDGSVAWLVMELVKGTTLAERCHNGPLSDHDVTEAGRQLADALRYVHGEGVIHRDVKPSNILFDDQRCLLADFGVARLVDSASLTVTGTMLGTPAYLAPEQVAGEPVGPPADVYSLGLVLAEALSGRRVFVGTAVETAAARLSKDPELPSGLAPEWRMLLRAMTRRDPAGRPSAAEVTELLDERLGLTRPMGFVPLAAAAAGAGAGAGEALTVAIEGGAPLPPADGVTSTQVSATSPAPPTATATPTEVLPPASARRAATETPPPANGSRRLAALAVVVAAVALGLGFLLAVLLGVGSTRGANSPPSTTATHTTKPPPASSTTTTSSSTTTTTVATPVGVAGTAGALVSAVETGSQNQQVTQKAAQDVLNAVVPLLSQSGPGPGGQVDQQAQQLAQVIGSDVQKGQILGSAVTSIEADTRLLARALGDTQALVFSAKHPGKGPGPQGG